MSWLKLLAPVFCLFICLFILSSPLMARDETSGDISAKDAAAMIKAGADDIVIVDVRTPAEFGQGHLSNARNIDFFGPAFEREAGRLPKDKTILLYCKSGKRSASAAEIVKEAGVKKVLSLTQGLNAWENAGLPVEKP